MAKLERGAKSAAIRQYLEANPQAGPKEVVDGLKAQGVNVKVGLVSAIKYGKNGAKKKTVKRGSASASAAIRTYLSQHPTAKPKEIRVALARNGVKAGPALIGKVKYLFKKERPAPRQLVAARKTAPYSLTIERLIEVKRLCDSLGGMDQVRQAIELLRQLQ